MKTGTGVVQKHGKRLFYCVLFHVLLHILLLRENRSQWFRHSEYTAKSGDGNEASSSIRVANRTLQTICVWFTFAYAVDHPQYCMQCFDLACKFYTRHSRAAQE